MNLFENNQCSKIVNLTFFDVFGLSFSTSTFAFLPDFGAAPVLGLAFEVVGRSVGLDDLGLLDFVSLEEFGLLSSSDFDVLGLNKVHGKLQSFSSKVSIIYIYIEI